MEETVHSPRLIRFGTFELDLQSGELRKSGLKLKLTGQPFQVLAILLEQPGAVVTREELQKRLWPDTFVDVDHNLNTAINKIREVLGDSSESPRFVETLPRRGYRFIAPIEDVEPAPPPAPPRGRSLRVPILIGASVLLAGAGMLVYRRTQVPGSTVQRTLTRLTFDDGLQLGATWSPDGRFIAYSSDRGGKFDIWVQQVSGGDPVQITKGPGHNWQPDWSPDGKYIAYRSENGSGGLFVVPSLGGEGLERKVASFGYYPLWSPDSSELLFRTHFVRLHTDRFYLVGLDGSTPREVLGEFVSQRKLDADSAAWHPDGKRISILVYGRALIPDFWTVPVAGGVAVKSEIAPEIVKQIAEQTSGPGHYDEPDLKFSWAPSGKAIYFGKTIRGALNLWKMSVDPETLRVTAIERLTTGSGPDSELDVSTDGKRLAFTGGTRRIRAWLFPFDATRDRVNGTGQAATSSGVEAWEQSMSRDGKKLAFCGIRAGKRQVWEKSLADGREAPVIADDYSRDYPQWAPDGTRLGYRRWYASAGESQIMIWSDQTHNEEPLTAMNTQGGVLWDWSPDGSRTLLTLPNRDTRLGEIWLLPVADSRAPQGPAAQKIISDPSYTLFQSHFSPNGQWIVFEAIRNSNQKVESTIYAVPISGGPWTRISGGKNWEDKPRWSPNGKAIYFVSNEGGLFNVWGIRFDPSKGKAVGEPFRVTAFENPSLMVPKDIGAVDLSVTQDKLVVTVEERSGSIWVLDNVDQ